MHKPHFHHVVHRRARGGFFDLRTLIFGSGAVALAAWFLPMASTLPGAGGEEVPPRYTGSMRDYLRVTKADGQVQELQTSIVRLVSRSGAANVGSVELVDLVSAVHVGDAGYYRTLQAQLSQYDAVLYELVAPEGVILPPAPAATAESMSPLGTLMAAGKRLFGFHGQLESMTYRQPNFVHADLSPAGMLQAMEARGDNGFTVALSAAADLMRAANLQTQHFQSGTGPTAALVEPDWTDVIALFTDPEGPLRFKRLLADYFDSTDVSQSLGSTLNTVLIEDRNGAALQTLNEQIAQGKRRIAIFYGAAHMPDMERRLMDDFGLERTKWHWLSAWDLRVPEPQVQALLPAGR